jgi:hypothetical protein
VQPPPPPPPPPPQAAKAGKKVAAAAEKKKASHKATRVKATRVAVSARVVGLVSSPELNDEEVAILRFSSLRRSDMR